MDTKPARPPESGETQAALEPKSPLLTPTARPQEAAEHFGDAQHPLGLRSATEPDNPCGRALELLDENIALLAALKKCTAALKEAEAYLFEHCVGDDDARDVRCIVTAAKVTAAKARGRT